MNKTKNFIMNQSADVMTINLYVFGMFMVDKISSNTKSSCIVTKKRNRVITSKAVTKSSYSRDALRSTH